MDWIPPDRRDRLRAASALILLASLVAAMVLYLTAGDDPGGDVLGYQEADGAYSPTAPEDSRKFLRQMEAVGGKANVLAWELRQWFEGLWRGRGLAGTVAVLGAALALGVYLAADRPPGSGPNPPDNRDGS